MGTSVHVCTQTVYSYIFTYECMHSGGVHKGLMSHIWVQYTCWDTHTSRLHSFIYPSLNQSTCTCMCLLVSMCTRICMKHDTFIVMHTLKRQPEHAEVNTSYTYTRDLCLWIYMHEHAIRHTRTTHTHTYTYTHFHLYAGCKTTYRKRRDKSAREGRAWDQHGRYGEPCTVSFTHLCIYACIHVHVQLKSLVRFADARVVSVHAQMLTRVACAHRAAVVSCIAFSLGAAIPLLAGVFISYFVWRITVVVVLSAAGLVCHTDICVS